MKHLRKTSLRSLTALAFVCAFAFAAARADVHDSRVISARAGGVNYVSGDVKVRRAASADWVALAAQDELDSGDTVRTGPTGRVEVLLNPGSYFRAGGGAEFTLASADLDYLRVELARGSAVVEATGYDDVDLGIDVAVRGAVVRVVRGGVYRFNAPAEGPVEVAVANGRAMVGQTKVKGGKVARISGETVEVAKFDKKWRDELDQWSRERGKELAKANERLNQRALRTAFGSYNSSFGGWGSGLWAYNSGLRCYTFLPYGYGWRSPYGYSYALGIYVSPVTGWRPVYTPGGVTIGNGVVGGGGGAGNYGGSGGSGGSGGGNSGSANNGGGHTVAPVAPMPVTPPARTEPMERGRERTIEPGFRRDQ